MKRFFIISFGLIYLSLTTGIQIHQHFCCGKLKEISFSTIPDVCCSNESSGCSINHRCCDIKNFTLRIEEEYHSPDILKSIKATPVIKCEIADQRIFSEDRTPDVTYVEAHAPPGDLGLYQLYCSLIVYG